MTATTAPAVPDERRRVLTTVALVAAIVSVMGARQFSGDDLDVYRGAGRALLDGLNPYTGPVPGTTISFSYTPFSTAVFVPLTALARPVAFFLLTLGSLACLWYVVRRVVDTTFADVGASTRLRIVAMVCAGLLLAEPVTETLGLGQMNLFIMAMVIGDVMRRRPSRWQGAWIGFATAFKLTPGIFIVYLLVTRRFRAAFTAMATFALTIALGFLVMPRGSVSYWIDGVGADPNHVGEVTWVANQSVLGSLSRMVGYASARPWWLALCVPILLFGLWLTSHVHRRYGDLAGLTTIAFVACLISPYSWSHHFVWFVVPALMLASWARRRGSAVAWLAPAAWALPFLAGPFWLVPASDRRSDHLPWDRALIASAYTIVTVIGFAIVTWLVTRPPSGARHRHVADDEAREVVPAG
jgi:alpha-1,2-mannosyltransferase